jgi:hypothetical protein
MAKITINMDSLKSGRDYVRHKINDGSNIYRILPPHGDTSVHNNYPYRRWSTVWLNDPKTNKPRPFATPLMDGKDCPIKEYGDALTARIEQIKNKLTSEGYSDSEIKTELEGLRKIQWSLKVNYTYVYNACDQAGTVGILELKPTAHKSMKKMMNLFITENSQDPTTLGASSDEYGVWFNILKEGQKKDTEYSVAFHQTKEKRDGRLVKIDDTSPLPDNVIENYDSLAYDLNAVYTRKTYADLKTLLLYNLSLVAQDVPEAILPGYEIEDANETVTKSVPVKTLPTLKSAPVTKVALNLRDEDDEDDGIPFGGSTKRSAAPVPVSAPTRKVVAKFEDDDELNRLTNEILGD